MQNFVGSASPTSCALAGEVAVDTVEADLTLKPTPSTTAARRGAPAAPRRAGRAEKLGASADGGLRFVPPQTGPAR
ncbi:MAG: hypothetical protein H6701_00905 [Myxococcales bacterium]|nr:hypothetical protein [Myxococcales bacterium]